MTFVDSDGHVTAVDNDDQALQAARALLERLGLRERVQLIKASVQDTGLDARSVDVAFMRNVLVHNGPIMEAILNHITALLRPGGHLLVAESDVTALKLTGAVPEESELERLWLELMRKRGNDPALGRRLTDVLSEAGFRIELTQERVDQLLVERSPVWTARQALVAEGLATEVDLGRWEALIGKRLQTTGKRGVQFPVYCVVAARP